MANLTLYHHGPSTCSQKVRLILELKKLPYESKEVNLLAGEQHDPEYVKLNPNHVVPTLVTNNGVLIESNLILEYLDDAYPEIPARPSSPEDIHKVRLWMKQIDNFQQYTGPITYGIEGLAGISGNASSRYSRIRFDSIKTPLFVTKVGTA